MRRSILFSALALPLLLAACSLLDTNPGPTPITGPTGGSVSINMVVDTAIGGHLYRTLCAQCHGDSGQGTQMDPKNIQGLGGMAPVIRTGQGVMPAYPSLSDSDISSIELYLSQFKVKGLDTMSGATVYRMYCATCHGDSAQGLTGKGIGIKGDTANVSNYVHNGGKTMPKFTQITETQIKQIKDFLNSFTMPTDGAGMFQLYCASCHGDKGQGVAGSGPAIQKDTAKVSDYVHNGGRLMAPIPALNDAQIAQITKFIGTLALPTDGAGLYMRYCATCHGTNAIGDSTITPGLAGNLTGTSNLTTIVRSGSRYNRRTGTYMMAPVPEVSSAQAALIGSYVQGLPYSHTGKDMYVMSCIQCHGSRGSEMDHRDIGALTSVLANGKESMPKYPNILSADLPSLQAYIQALH